jgi:hypothetical protein
MIFFIRYIKNLGNAAVGARLRDSQGRYWNFVTLAWVTSESANTKVFMTEYSDADTLESLYQSADIPIPTGGPWRQEAFVDATGEVLAYDNTAAIVDPDALSSAIAPVSSLVNRLIRDQYFAYVGNASNVVSLINGSFVGLVHFYFIDQTDFLASPISAPVLANRICTLHPDGTMTNVGGIANSGDILLFALDGFEALEDLTINLFNNATKTNIRIYLPMDLIKADITIPYYPTTLGSIMTSNGTDLVNVAETAYGKALALIPTINFDRLVQPMVVTTGQPTILT